MKLEIFNYRTTLGWSVPQFPNLDSDKTLILIFGSPEFINHRDPISQLLAFYPKSHIIGCSSAGEIFQSRIYDHSLSVAVVKFDHCTLLSTSTIVENAERSYHAAELLAKDLAHPGLRGVFVLSDGLNINGSALTRGLRDHLSSKMIITGGLAGDGDRFQETWIIKNSAPQTHVVAAVGFYGASVQLHFGSCGGWDVFGPERRITHTLGNVLYEIDYQPALTLYKTYLGDRAHSLPAAGLLFPLAIRKSREEEPVVRTILSVDPNNLSMRFAGDMPNGWLCQLMRANFDRLIDGAERAAKNTNINTDPSSNLLSIAISCVGRRLVLKARAEEEVEAVLGALPPLTQQIGFYSYGEISPSRLIGCDLHNQTMTLTTISEKI